MQAISYSLRRYNFTLPKCTFPTRAWLQATATTTTLDRMTSLASHVTLAVAEPFCSQTRCAFNAKASFQSFYSLQFQQHDNISTNDLLFPYYRPNAVYIKFTAVKSASYTKSAIFVMPITGNSPLGRRYLPSRPIDTPFYWFIALALDAEESHYTTPVAMRCIQVQTRQFTRAELTCACVRACGLMTPPLTYGTCGP